MAWYAYDGQYLLSLEGDAPIGQGVEGPDQSRGTKGSIALQGARSTPRDRKHRDSCGFDASK